MITEPNCANNNNNNNNSFLRSIMVCEPRLIYAVQNRYDYYDYDDDNNNNNNYYYYYYYYYHHRHDNW